MRAKNWQRGARLPESQDPVFFLNSPLVKCEDIADFSPRQNPQAFARTDGGVSRILPDRFICAPFAASELTGSGTVIPIAHFRPLVRQLIDRGEITTYSARDTMRQVMGITSRLIPNHLSDNEPGYVNAILRHGEHFSPLIAVRERVGRCNDWTAVFAAIGRNAGLNVEVRGDPRFFNAFPRFKDLPPFYASHVWPVVVGKSGDRIPVAPRIEIPGAPEEGIRNEHMEISRAINSGNYPVYSEHRPARPLRIPPELVVRRPDVFGD